MLNDKTPEGRLKPSVRCTHSYTLFESNEWSVVKYIDSDTGENFTACGGKLPTQKETPIVLHGKWTENPKYGRQFMVDYFEVELPATANGIISYLCTLKVGIGKMRATAIYNRFGSRIWDIMENNPDELLKISGITSKTIKKLSTALEATRIHRKIMELCGEASKDITPKMLNYIVTYFEKRDEDAIEAIKRNPYELTNIKGFGFETVDKMAQKMAGFQPDAQTRIFASLPYIFNSKAREGHVCVPKKELVREITSLLNKDYPGAVSEDTCRDALNQAYHDKLVRVTGDMVYSYNRYMDEVGIVDELARLMSTDAQKIGSVKYFIGEYEKSEHISFEAAQQAGIESVFQNQVSILTGGPGTGKTTTIKGILYVHEQVFGTSSEPVLLAPTGRAARRMSEATGFPASTIHSAVGYHGTDIMDEDAAALSGNLFIVDEVSMADQFIMHYLLARIPDEAKVVFVGDPDQLPSVGCGNVLHELIRSRVIPMTKLSVIHRQAQDNPIVENSLRIHNGQTDLIYPKDRFPFYEKPTNLEVFQKACSLYIQAVKKLGLDNVILLNPYRTKSEISVKKFNLNLQYYVNPPVEGAMTMKIRDIEFRAGDKVMQTRNTDLALNGDIGYIREIIRKPNPDDPQQWAEYAVIEFNGDGILHEYGEEAMQDLDLAYCTTIHKAQGAEFQMVIMVVSSIHPMALRRNQVYTGITRAKEIVALVGEKSALKQAIANDQSDERYTLLADRLHKRLSTQL